LNGFVYYCFFLCCIFIIVTSTTTTIITISVTSINFNILCSVIAITIMICTSITFGAVDALYTSNEVEHKLVFNRRCQCFEKKFCYYFACSILFMVERLKNSLVKGAPKVRLQNGSMRHIGCLLCCVSDATFGNCWQLKQVANCDT